ncbi:hypothetical protein [Halobacillus sp. H74]|uniref:hypothetical protein n=1 Tax=Halobacillus sp. H74 TaxID=3457436 RepID=UPI003FCCB0CC
MAESIYAVNSGNIVGGPGRLVAKKYDGTFPATISDVMNTTSPFDLVDGWEDLGATNEGITTNRSFDTEDFTVDQVNGPVDTDITEWTHTLETQLAENTVENRQLALIGGTITETAPTLGTETTLTGDVSINATVIDVTSAADMSEGSFIQLSEGGNLETKQVSRLEGTTVYLTSPVSYSYTSTGASVTPVTEPGYKRIGYGTVSVIPQYTYALISQKKDGSLYMAVFRKAQISGEDKEQTYSGSKRLLPLTLTAFADDAAPEDENVYYEIEQVF